jgi:hypothetical protein
MSRDQAKADQLASAHLDGAATPNVQVFKRRWLQIAFFVGFALVVLSLLLAVPGGIRAVLDELARAKNWS